jgi:hypothetical protein
MFPNTSLRNVSFSLFVCFLAAGVCAGINFFFDETERKVRANNIIINEKFVFFLFRKQLFWRRFS